MAALVASVEYPLTVIGLLGVLALPSRVHFDVVLLEHACRNVPGVQHQRRLGLGGVGCWVVVMGGGGGGV